MAEPLAIIAKCSILDVAGILDPPLAIILEQQLFVERNFYQTATYWK